MLLRCTALFAALLIRGGAGHGAVNYPRPRNNDASTGVINYGMKFTQTGTGRVAMGSYNIADCHSGHQTQEYPVGACVPPPRTEAWRPSYVFSLTPPSGGTGRLVDCTPRDNCSDPAAASAQVGGEGGPPFVWLSQYDGDTHCVSVPAVTYKMHLDACTQVPFNGETYPYGGCEGMACQWFSQGCTIGCPECVADDGSHPSGSLCNSTKAPTLPPDPKFRTWNRYNTDPKGDWTRAHPWRAPGNAPILDPCGMAGGSPKRNDGPGGHAPPGHQLGDRGSSLPTSAEKPTWTSGSTVEVSWGIAANHGGGYQYRLCPAWEPLTEECFQKTPIPFATNTQKLKLGSGKIVELSGTFVSSGTTPAGSTWAMNPVPACRGDYNVNCDTPQFPPPQGCDETCWGSEDNATLGKSLPWIIDTIQLPRNLTPGGYVLGWRWDCEQTTQVWCSCSDVFIH